MQLNGVELPCGSILTAEPATLDYKRDERRNHDHNIRTSTSDATSNSNLSLVTQRPIVDASNVDNINVRDDVCDRKSSERCKDESDAEKENDEDLDDFFSSLE